MSSIRRISPDDKEALKLGAQGLGMMVLIVAAPVVTLIASFVPRKVSHFVYRLAA